MNYDIKVNAIMRMMEDRDEMESRLRELKYDLALKDQELLQEVLDAGLSQYLKLDKARLRRHLWQRQP